MHEKSISWSAKMSWSDASDSVAVSQSWVLKIDFLIETAVADLLLVKW